MTRAKNSPVISPNGLAYLKAQASMDAGGRPKVTEAMPDGSAVEFWIEAGKVCHRKADAPNQNPVLSAPQESITAEFGKLSVELMKDGGGDDPDISGIELVMRERLLKVRAEGLQGLLEAIDESLDVPKCKVCNSRMQKMGYREKTFTTSMGTTTVKRRRVHCRVCGKGHFPLDRHLSMMDESVTPGAATLLADLVKDFS